MAAKSQAKGASRPSTTGSHRGWCLKAGESAVAGAEWPAILRKPSMNKNWTKTDSRNTLKRKVERKQGQMHFRADSGPDRKGGHTQWSK